MNQASMNEAASELEAEVWRLNCRSMTVRSVCTSLRRGYLDIALGEIRMEGDKLRQYPSLVAILEKWFGCRIHSVHNCQSWICEVAQ